MTVYLPKHTMQDRLGLRPTRPMPVSYTERVDAFERTRDAAARTLPQLPR